MAKLEALLTRSDQMVAANALLREMLGEVRVQGDPDLRKRMRVELRGEACQLFQVLDGTTKGAPEGAVLSAMQISAVSGTGFELCFAVPTTSQMPQNAMHTRKASHG